MSIKTKLFVGFIGFTWLMVVLSWIFPNGNWVFLNWLTMAIFATWIIITVKSIKKALASRKHGTMCETMDTIKHVNCRCRLVLRDDRNDEFIKFSKRRDLR